MNGDIVLSAENAGAALQAVTACREAAKPARVVVELEHPVAMRARAIWRELAGFTGDRDAVLEELRARRAVATDPIDDEARERYRTILALADDVVCSSWVHVRGLEGLLRAPVRNVRIAMPAASLTRPKSQRAATYVAIVVAQEDAEARAYAQLALGDLHAPVRFVAAAHVHECADATVLVDAHWRSPANAVAAAALGVPIVVSLTSGAREFVRAAAAYDPLAPETLADAVRRALGAQDAAMFTVAPVAPAAATHVSQPHVTFFITDGGSPQALACTLESVRGQRGATVDAIVLSERDAPAIERAHGTYVQVLDAGDVLFPDHAASLAGALDRSGANIAYNDCLNGGAAITRDIIDRDALLVNNPLGGGSRAMFRRSALVSVGGFHPLPAVREYVAMAQLSRAGDIVHVPRVTLRSAGVSNAGSPPRAALEAVYAALPLRGRPLVERRRSEERAE